MGQLRDDVVSEEERIIGRLETVSDDQFDYLALPGDQRDVIHQRLMHLRAELRLGYKQLRVEGRKLQARYKEGDKDTIAAKIRAIPLDVGQVRWLFGLPETSTDTEPDYSKLDEDESLARARELFRKPEFDQAFTEAARVLRKQMTDNIVDPIYKKCKGLFRPPDDIPEGLSDDDRNWIVIQKYLWRYFSQFDDFDQISFPILYGVEEGESDVVEIIRISPEDATKLINERKERKTSADGVGRRKLAGVALHHFGAFLDRTWRQNDIMWGRLDGAERLITALLPDPKDKGIRDEMIRQAHSAILIEEMPVESRHQLGLLMSDALMRASAGAPLGDTITKLIKELDSDSSLSTRLETIMRSSLQDDEFLQFVATGYEVNRKTDAKEMLRAMSRSTQVIGKVFEDIANQNGLDGKSLAWIARFGQIFWGLVEVAVPGSIKNMLMMHWLKLLYVFELLLIILGFLFSAPPALQDFTFRVFLITVVINVAVLLLRDTMRGRRKVLVGVVVTLVAFIGLFALVGVADLLGLGWSDWIRAWFEPVKGAVNTARAWLQPIRDVLAKLY